MKTKLMITLSLVVILVFSFAMVTWAQTATPTSTPQSGYGGMGGQMQGWRDNLPGMSFMHRFMDQNSDGHCDNFVDANNDGICDNAGTGMMGGRGMMGGNMMGRGMMQGRGMGFVDADSNGVCDHREAAPSNVTPTPESSGQ